ncbi:MAG: SDR family oxidoreductase [Verrucomicrobia bacterium]|nr:SDR family oxidoreductase [Verrucomicrobiota bacterium]
MNPQRLHGKCALVTGASAGIGAVIVRRCVAEGARVLVGDRDQPRGETLCQAFGPATVFHGLEVSDVASFADAISHAVTFGRRLDILVNNAGIALPAATVQDTTLDQFEQLADVNLRSVFLGCKLAYPHLKVSRGCVLNISSVAGVTGQERHAVYGATKGAINALMKCTAVDWGRDGIRINALCPAGVWTDRLRQWMKAQPDAPASPPSKHNGARRLIGGVTRDARAVASLHRRLTPADRNSRKAPTSKSQRSSKLQAQAPLARGCR